MNSFPNPERLDKVAISMENIETVVRERNLAYHLLETGEHGERPSVEDTNCFGLKYTRDLSQHEVPVNQNPSWQKEYDLYHKTDDHEYIKKFLIDMNEKKLLKENYEKV